MDEPELKSCPFCGAEPVIQWEPLLGGPELYIHCGNDECLGASFQDADPEKAIASWQRRAGESQ